MFVERLAQRSKQYPSFDWHFWQISQNATVFCFMRFDFYAQFVNALTYLLTAAVHDTTQYGHYNLPQYPLDNHQKHHVKRQCTLPQVEPNRALGSCNFSCQQVRMWLQEGRMSLA